MDVLNVKTWIPFDALYDRGELDYNMFMRMLNAMDEKSIKNAINVLSGEKGMEVLRHICHILDRTTDCDTFNNIKDLRDSVLFTVSNLIGEETIFTGDWKNTIIEDLNVDGPDTTRLTYNDVKNDPDLLMRFYHQYGISDQYGSGGIPLRGENISSDLAGIYKIEYLDKYRKELSQKYGSKVLRYKEKFPLDWTKYVNAMIDTVKNNPKQFPSITERYSLDVLPDNAVIQNFPIDKYDAINTDGIHFSYDFLQFSLPYTSGRIRWDKKEIIEQSPPFYHPGTNEPMRLNALESYGKNVHAPIENLTEAHQYNYVMERILGHEKSLDTFETGFLDWAEEYLQRYGELSDQQIVQFRADEIRRRNSTSGMVQFEPISMVEKHNIKYLKEKNAYYVKDPNYMFSAAVPFNIPDSVLENFKNTMKESVEKGLPYKGVQSTINPETKNIMRVEYQIVNKNDGTIQKKIIADHILLINIGKLLDLLFKEIYSDQYFLNAKASAIAFSESLKKVKMILRAFKKGETLNQSILKLFDYDIVLTKDSVKLIGVGEYSINFKNYKDIVYKLFNEYITDYANYSKILINTELHGMDQLMIERKKIPTKSEVDKVINDFINFAMLLNNKSDRITEANMTIQEYQEKLASRDKILREVRTEYEKTRNYLSNVFIANYARKFLLYNSTKYRSYPYVFKLLNNLFSSISPVDIKEHIKEAQEVSDTERSIMFEPMIENNVRYMHQQQLDHIIHGRLPLFVYENNNEFVIHRQDLENDYRITKGATLIDYNNSVETMFKYNSLIPDFTFLYPDIFVLYCLDRSKIDDTDPDSTDKSSYRYLYDIERVEGDKTTTVQVRDIIKNLKRINDLRDNNNVWDTAVKKRPPIGLPDHVKYNWILSSYDRGVYYRMIFGNYLTLYNLSIELFENYDRYQSLDQKVQELKLDVLNTYRLIIDFIGIKQNMVEWFDSMTPLQLLVLIEEIETKMYLHDDKTFLESSVYLPVYNRTGIEEILERFGVNIDKMILYNQEKYNLQERYIKSKQIELTKKYESVAHTARLIYKKEYDIYVMKANKNKKRLTLLPIKILRELMDNDDKIKMTEYVSKKIDTMTDTSIQPEYLQERLRFIITTITHFVHFLYKIYTAKKRYIEYIVDMDKLMKANQEIRTKAENLVMTTPLKEKVENAKNEVTNKLIQEFKVEQILLMKNLFKKYGVEKILDNYDYGAEINEFSLKELKLDPYYNNILLDESIKDILNKNILTFKSVAILYILCAREKRLDELMTQRTNIIKQEEQYRQSFIRIMNDVVLDKIRDKKFVYTVDYDTLKKAEDSLKEREGTTFSDVGKDAKSLYNIILNITGIKTEYTDIANLSTAEQQQLEYLMQRYNDIKDMKIKIQDDYDKALKNASKRISSLKKQMKNVVTNITPDSPEEDKQLAKEIIKNIKKQTKALRIEDTKSEIKFNMKSEYLKNVYAGLVEITTQQNIKVGDELPYHNGYRVIRYDTTLNSTENSYTVYKYEFYRRFTQLLTEEEGRGAIHFNGKNNEVFTVRLLYPLDEKSVALKYLKSYRVRDDGGVGKVVEIIQNDTDRIYILQNIKEKIPSTNVKVGLRDIDPFKFTVMVNGKEVYPLKEYYEIVLKSIRPITGKPNPVGSGYPVLVVRKRADLTRVAGTPVINTNIDDDPKPTFIVKGNPNLVSLTVRASRGLRDMLINAWDIISINNDYKDRKPIPIAGGATGSSMSTVPSSASGAGVIEEEYYEYKEQEEELFDEDDEGEIDYGDEPDDDDKDDGKLDYGAIFGDELEEEEESDYLDKNSKIYDEYFNVASVMYRIAKFAFFGKEFEFSDQQRKAGSGIEMIPGSAFGLSISKLAEEQKEHVKSDVLTEKIATKTSKALLEDITENEVNNSIVKILKFMDVYYSKIALGDEAGLLYLAELGSNIKLPSINRLDIQRKLATLALCIIFYYDFVASRSLGQKVEHHNPPTSLKDGIYTYVSNKGDIIDYLGNVYNVYDVVDTLVKGSSYEKLDRDTIATLLKHILLIFGNGTIADDSYTYRQIASVTIDLIKTNAETLANLKNVYVKPIYFQFVRYAPSKGELNSYILNYVSDLYHELKIPKQDISGGSAPVQTIDQMHVMNRLKGLRVLDPKLYDFIKNMMDGNINRRIAEALFLTNFDQHFGGRLYNLFDTIKDLWKNKDPTYLEHQILSMFKDGYRPDWFSPFMNQILGLMNEDELFNYLGYEINRATGQENTYSGAGMIVDESMRKAFMSIGNYSYELHTDPKLYFYYNLLVKLNKITNSNDMLSYSYEILRNYDFPGYIKKIISYLDILKSNLKLSLQNRKIESSRVRQKEQISAVRVEESIGKVLEIIALENCISIFLDNNIKSKEDFDKLDDKDVKRCKHYWHQIYQYKKDISGRQYIKDIIRDIDNIIPISDASKLDNYIKNLESKRNDTLMEICNIMKKVALRTYAKDDSEIVQKIKEFDCNILTKQSIKEDVVTNKTGAFPIPKDFMPVDKGEVNVVINWTKEMETKWVENKKQPWKLNFDNLKAGVQINEHDKKLVIGDTLLININSKNDDSKHNGVYKVTNTGLTRSNGFNQDANVAGFFVTQYMNVDRVIKDDTVLIKDELKAGKNGLEIGSVILINNKNTDLNGVFRVGKQGIEKIDFSLTDFIPNTTGTGKFKVRKWIVINPSGYDKIGGKIPIVFEVYTGAGSAFEREQVFNFIKDTLYAFKKYLDDKKKGLVISDYNTFLRTVEVYIRRKLTDEEKNEILKVSLQTKKLEKYLYKLSGSISSSEYISSILNEIENDYNKYYPVPVQSTIERSKSLITSFSKILKTQFSSEQEQKIAHYSSNANYIRQYIMSIIDKNDEKIVYEINAVINKTYHTTNYKLDVIAKFKLDDVISLYTNHGYSLDVFPNILDIYPYIPNESEDNTDNKKYTLLKLKVHLFYLNTFLYWNHVKPLKIIDLNHIEIDFDKVGSVMAHLIAQYAHFAYFINDKELDVSNDTFHFEIMKKVKKVVKEGTEYVEKEYNVPQKITIPIKNATKHEHYRTFVDSLNLKHDATTLHTKLGRLIEISYKELLSSKSLSSIDSINSQIKEIIMAVWNRIMNVPISSLLDALLKLYDQFESYDRNNNIIDLCELVLKTIDRIHSELVRTGKTQNKEGFLMKYKKSIRKIYTDELMKKHKTLIDKYTTIKSSDYYNQKEAAKQMEKLKPQIIDVTKKINLQLLYTKVSINDNELTSRIRQILAKKLPKRFKSKFEMFYYNNQSLYTDRDEAVDAYKKHTERLSYHNKYTFVDLTNPLLRKEREKGIKPNESVFKKYLVKMATKSTEKIDLGWDSKNEDEDLKKALTTDNKYKIPYDILYTELDPMFSKKEIYSQTDIQQRYDKDIWVFLDIDGYDKNKFPVGVYKRKYDVTKSPSGEYIYKFYLEQDQQYVTALTDKKDDIYIYVGNDKWLILKKNGDEYSNTWIEWTDDSGSNLRDAINKWLDKTSAELVQIIKTYNGKYVSEELIALFDHKDYDVFKKNVNLMNDILNNIKYEVNWIANAMKYYKSILPIIKDELFVEQTKLMYNVDVSDMVINKRNDPLFKKPSPLELYRVIYRTNTITIPIDEQEKQEKLKKLSYIIPLHIHIYYDESLFALQKDTDPFAINSSVDRPRSQGMYSLFNDKERAIAEKITEEYKKIVNKNEVPSREEIRERIERSKTVSSASTGSLERLRKDYESSKKAIEKALEGEPGLKAESESE